MEVKLIGSRAYEIRLAALRQSKAYKEFDEENKAQISGMIQQGAFNPRTDELNELCQAFGCESDAKTKRSVLNSSSARPASE